MPTLLVGYDLDKPYQDYPELIEAIKNISGTWWHHLDSTWLINTDASPEKVCNELMNHIGASDKLIVMNVGESWATANMPKKATAWLRDCWKSVTA